MRHRRPRSRSTDMASAEQVAPSKLAGHYAISVNPATGEEIARFPCHDADAQDAILAAASQAQRAWAALSIDARAAYLTRLGALSYDADGVGGASGSTFAL